MVVGRQRRRREGRQRREEAGQRERDMPARHEAKNAYKNVSIIPCKAGSMSMPCKDAMLQEM